MSNPCVMCVSGGHLCNGAGGAERSHEEGLRGFLHVCRQTKRNAESKTTAIVGKDILVNNPVRSAKRLCLLLQVTLKPLDLQDCAEEMLEHSLASERRRLRLYNEEAFKNLMSDYYNLQDKGERFMRCFWLGSVRLG